MSSSAKGNKLEDLFYDYLIEQQASGCLVYGLFSSRFCKIYKKRKYYCREREADVEFDVVIEVFREGGTDPILYVVFECKNHDRNIEEDRITPFSDKIGRLFPHANKGVLVVSSPLQSGAEAVALKRKMGIVKFCEQGFEVVADRTGNTCIEGKFIKSQFFRTVAEQKPLKFVAYHDGRFFGSLDQFLQTLDPDRSDTTESGNDQTILAIPYISAETIRGKVEALLEKVEYSPGPVDLEKLCSLLSIKLRFSNEITNDSNQ